MNTLSFKKSYKYNRLKLQVEKKMADIEPYFFLQEQLVLCKMNLDRMQQKFEHGSYSKPLMDLYRGRYKLCLVNYNTIVNEKRDVDLEASLESLFVACPPLPKLNVLDTL